MKNLKMLSLCFVALIFSAVVWGEIYETKDAEGNTEFTDSPRLEDAEEIELQQPNLVAPPAQESRDGAPEAAQGYAAPQSGAPVGGDNVDMHRDADGDGVYEDGVYEDGAYVDGVDQRALRRDEGVRPGDPAVPHEAVDGEARTGYHAGESHPEMPDDRSDMMPHDRSDVMPHDRSDMPANAGELHRR